MSQPIHIPIQRKTDDWLWETDAGSYLHFEFQSDYDKQDLARFMLSDAMLHFKTGKPIKTVVVYSADIRETLTALNAGAIQYQVDAFYMSALDGDQAYADIKAKVNAGESLTKQDLMSIVFLPMMKGSVDKATRFEQSITLSNEICTKVEQAQIQAMLQLLAEKLVTNPEQLKKLKERINMGVIAEMIANDKAVEIAKSLLKEGMGVNFVTKHTGLSESDVRELKAEVDAA